MPTLAAPALRALLVPLALLAASARPPAQAAASVPGTAPLTLEGDLSAQMIAGIDRFLEAETTRVAAERPTRWPATVSSDRAAYEKSVQPHRDRLAVMLGLIDPRVKQVDVEYLAPITAGASVGPAASNIAPRARAPVPLLDTGLFSAHAIRWSVLDGLFAEGILLNPKGPVRARVVALPDADQQPEVIAGLTSGLSPQLQYARRLAESGCQVIVPALLDRASTHSGHPDIGLFTNQPHREWIFRQSFVLGRHVTGYEIQKILAAVDWFTAHAATTVAPNATPIGIVGWGEGGLLALYSAAVDRRIDVTLVSGYFAPREQLWREPIYRNLFGVLTEFGDADLARLIVPRTLLVEHGPTPKFDGPQPDKPGRSGAAPGRLLPITLSDVQAEFARARRHAGPYASSLQLFHGRDDAPVGPIAEATLAEFLRRLGPPDNAALRAPVTPASPPATALPSDPARLERTLRGMENYTQRHLQNAERVRAEFLWNKVKPTTPDAWHAAMQPYRRQVWHEMIGHYAPRQVPLNPRSRLLFEKPAFTVHEVVLDVLPGVYAWGYLLVPKNIPAGEKRPVVVCQHGVRGLPASVVTQDPDGTGFAAYQGYAARLAERGFITFAPHNPYRGDDASRVLQRKANPIGKTIFAIILAQHEAILDFLSAQPNIDPARIAFYGLSYGGQSAMRLPILLDRYALAISSGDFNEWTWKNASTSFSKSYMYNNAYERPEFRMGLTFGYAEMAALMVPRPFMVERGHNDSVAIDEWVAYEYAKVFRLYNKLRLADRTAIEYFDGPHTIHGQGTFAFLHHHLRWPPSARWRRAGDGR